MAGYIATKGFPGINLNCTFVPVRSRNRRCEFRSVGNSTFVILDLELSDRLMELDLLVQVSSMKPDWVYAYLVILLGDVFRQQRDLTRYRYCVLKALGDTESWRGLSSLPKEGPPIHAAIAPVLLHELAHLAFRNNADFVDGLRSLCRVALDRFADLSAEQAATGRQPIPGGTTLGIPFENYDQDRLKQQLESYAATIRNNAELEEELTCDLIGALALINFETGTNCFHEISPRTMKLSVRQLGDIFYLAVKTSRYLQVLTGIQQLGANITAGIDGLHRGIIEMTARTNALTHLLLNIFQGQIEVSEFYEKPDFGKPLTNDQIMGIMHQSMARLMKQHHESLLEPFENLSEFFITPEAFDHDNNEVFSRFSDAIPDSFESVDDFRRQLPL